ncbi:hypothetical protein KIL84_007831, partial [Mauremys mutica]
TWSGCHKGMEIPCQIPLLQDSPWKNMEPLKLAQSPGKQWDGGVDKPAETLLQQSK